MSEIIKEVLPDHTNQTPMPEAIPAGKQPFLDTEMPAASEDPTVTASESQEEVPVNAEPAEKSSPFTHSQISPKEKRDAEKAIYEDITDHSAVFTPADEIAFKITEDHITEYLEGSREARLQRFKEEREKRLLTAFELAAALASVVLIVYFLKDNPAILVNILYIIGALAGLWLWKKPNAHHKNDKKDDE